MPKRGAENGQMRKEEYEYSQRHGKTEEAGKFSKLSSEKLSTRKIVKIRNS